PVMQTGVNFGTEVMHANPSLSAVGTGTMVASGLTLVNDEVSSSSFRVSRVAIGPHNFVGNDVIYPAGGRTGDNVLLGTKVMVPLDGKIHEGVGLLGAPCFEIPRSVERDSRFDHLLTGEPLRRGLAAKNRYNLRTIGLFLFTRWVGVFLFALPYLAGIELYDVLPHVVSAVVEDPPADPHARQPPEHVLERCAVERVEIVNRMHLPQALGRPEIRVVDGADRRLHRV